MKIPFNIPLCIGNEKKYLSQVLESHKFSGDQEFTKKCHKWFEERLPGKKVLLTTSCTHALEMAALLLDIRDGDEVILPSFTFVSTANPFVLRGAKLKFVDIDPLIMNMDLNEVSKAITKRTKAIVPVHYAGISCDMDKLLEIANSYNIPVVEDAAQGVMAKYKDKALGSIGSIGAYSFHETKNYHCGEGGLIILDEHKYYEKGEVLREKGTNRAKFFRGEIDKYTWVDIGSSYLPSELNAAFLYGQLEKADLVLENRLSAWNYYWDLLMDLKNKELIELPNIPKYASHNGHLFYIKVKNLGERTNLIAFLREKNIVATFHYIPLHNSTAGKKFGMFMGEDKYTTRESERIVRLPLYYGITKNEIEYVCSTIYEFYGFKN